MQRIDLSSKLNISRIVYGMCRLVSDPKHCVAHGHAKIEACLESGITTFDQADIYGGYQAEESLGEILQAARHLRDKIEIITKCGIIAPVGRYSDKRIKHYNTSIQHITQSAEASLRLMRIDRIDLLLIHRPDPFMNHVETAHALDRLVDNGKVRAVGVSNFKPHDVSLLSSAMKHPLVTNQIEISLKCNAAFTNGDLAYLQERQISPMAWSPFGGGSLFSDENRDLLNKIENLANYYDCDISAIAIAWLLAHPAKIVPIVGTNSLSRIAALKNIADISLDRETWFELYELANGHEVP